jgi:hypothetical protein
MVCVNVASFFVSLFIGKRSVFPSYCSEMQHVLCFSGSGSGSGNITNRPSPTRESFAALRGECLGRAVQLKR